MFAKPLIEHIDQHPIGWDELSVFQIEPVGYAVFTVEWTKHSRGAEKERAT
jgi:hypothetical protein